MSLNTSDHPIGVSSDHAAAGAARPFRENASPEQTPPGSARSETPKHLRAVENPKPARLQSVPPRRGVDWPTVSAAVHRLEETGQVDPNLAVSVPARELVDLFCKLESQPAIEQAKGILMGHYKIDAETAFLVLRRWSQDGNIKLRALAQAVVEETIRNPDDPSAPHELVHRVISTAIQAPE